MSTCRSLFNLEGAIERLCTFKRGKEKDKFRGPCINRKVEIWGCSSAGRAPALQAGGQEFDSPRLHQSLISGLTFGRTAFLCAKKECSCFPVYKVSLENGGGACAVF